METYDDWIPMFPEDFKINNDYDPLSYIRHQVFKLNEAWDIRVLGFRGGGKSTVGLSLALLLNPKLLTVSAEAAIDRCWAFTTENRLEKKKKLHRGDVLVTDEQGTRKSGSSHRWQSQENQFLADQRQLDRVDGVIEIGITLDEMRVIKRVRDIYRVDIRPVAKLSTSDNKGIGMGIECILREIVDDPFENNSGEFKMQYFRYTEAGRITKIVLPLPPVDIWNAYMIKRKEFKEELDSEEIPTLKQSVDNIDSSYSKVRKMHTKKNTY